MTQEQEIIHLTEKTLRKQRFNPDDFRSGFQYSQAIRRREVDEFTKSDYALGLIFSVLILKGKIL